MAHHVAEIVEKRSLYARHYSTDEEGVVSAELFSEPVNYHDKLGDGLWHPIDLAFQAVEGGWEIKKHLYHASVPKFADEWIEVRDLFESKDQTIRLRPQCAHVEGVLLESLEGVLPVNVVLYTDAYGEGRDLILAPTRTGIQKVIRIREGYYSNETILFPFEIEWPEGRAVKRANEQGDYYLVSLEGGKVFDSDKFTLIEDAEAEGGTIIDTYRAWDSEHSTHINVHYSVDGGNHILTKEVPSDFLGQASGDVFTDATIQVVFGVSGQNASYPSSTNERTIRCEASTNLSMYRGEGTKQVYEHIGGNRLYYGRTTVGGAVPSSWFRPVWSFRTGNVLPRNCIITSADFRVYNSATGGNAPGSYWAVTKPKTTTTWTTDDFSSWSRRISDDLANLRNTFFNDFGRHYIPKGDSTNAILHIMGRSELDVTFDPIKNPGDWPTLFGHFLGCRHDSWSFNFSVPRIIVQYRETSPKRAKISGKVRLPGYRLKSLPLR